MDLRQWRAELPVQRTQCAESGYGWRCREGQRWSGPSSRQTSRRNRKWSHTWSGGRRWMAIGVTHIMTHEVHKNTHNSTETNLQREEDHCKAHDGSDAHRHHHWVSVMEAGDHPHHVGHAEGQDGLKRKKKQIYQKLQGFKSGFQTKYFLILYLWTKITDTSIHSATCLNNCFLFPVSVQNTKGLPVQSSSMDAFVGNFHSNWWRKRTQKICRRTQSRSKRSPWQIPSLLSQRWKRLQRQMSPAAEQSAPRRPGKN